MTGCEENGTQDKEDTNDCPQKLAELANALCPVFEPFEKRSPFSLHRNKSPTLLSSAKRARRIPQKCIGKLTLCLVPAEYGAAKFLLRRFALGRRCRPRITLSAISRLT
jgi:hypothetical protein